MIFSRNERVNIIGTVSKITSKTCIFSSFFSPEKISKEVMYHTICVNYEAKIEDGTGAGPKWRLRLQPNTPAPGGSGFEILNTVCRAASSKVAGSGSTWISRILPDIGSEYFVSATSVNTGIFYVVVMKSFSFNAALKNFVRLSFLIIDNHNH